MKLTDWYDGSVKPVHPGWYQRKDLDGFDYYWYFDGNKWRLGGFINIQSAYIVNQYSPARNLPWRGLAEKP